MKLLLFLFTIFLVNCDIKKNPLAPNGPFGVVSYFFNLSKVGTWKYIDNEVLYYNQNDPILPNSPNIPSPALANTFTISETLPTRLNFNTSNGVISGTPTSPLEEKEFRFTANLKPLPDRPNNTSSLKLNVDYFAMSSGLNNPFSAEFPFPDDFTYSNYSIEPSLPTGFSFDSQTGIISGPVQTETKNFGTYKVRATREDGVNVVGSASLKVTEWVFEAYLKAPNAEASDSFGYISIDKDTIIVGTVGEDSLQTTITNGTLVQAPDMASDLAVGAVYVFKRTENTWANEAYLKAPNAEGGAAGTGDRFGRSVAISGDTIVVGADQEDSNQTTITNGSTASADNSSSDSGAVYVFRRTGNTWINEAYLKAPNAGSGDSFGRSLAISGDTIVVGAIAEDSNQTTITNGTQTIDGTGANNSGAAYVFRRTGTIWTNEAYLKAPNAEVNDNFGFPLAIFENTIVVGARLEDSLQTTITNGTLVQASDTASDLSVGAAYVFRRTGSTWANEAYLKAPNAEGGATGTGDRFGISVAIFKNTIVVGSDKEDSLQTTITNGTLRQTSDGSATNSGAAYVFRRKGNIWTNESYLKAPNAEGGDEFGGTVSLSGNTIVIGAIFEDSNQTTITNGTLSLNGTGATDSGAAYVFKRTRNTWVNEAYLKASNTEGGDFFGSQFAVSISMDTIVIGANQEDSNQTTITNGNSILDNNSASNSGAVYVFVRK
ncbi:MAG: FG-GAP repeat protein [Leptospiraceae bacterium]|nr:FG-GAP repeat protein [Leptospiraceae bacterium]